MHRSKNGFSVISRYCAIDYTGAFNHSSYRSCMLLHVAFLFVPGIIFFLVLVSPAAALDWTTETVDTTGDVGWYTSLALDDSDRPRISYMDWTNYHLKYAAQKDGIWIDETVDAAHGVGEFSSLKLDASAQPLISYYDGNQGNLTLAMKIGDAWTRVTVDSGSVGRYTSLALDSSGNPRMAYQDPPNMRLKYAEKNSDLWTNETVDNSGNVGAYSSLALDSDGNPSISYYDAGHGFLKYAVKSGGLWFNTTIDNTGNTGYYTSIALDDAGNPGISYYDKLNKDLKFASKTGGVWKKEIVDSAGDVGMYTSLSFDASGNPHVSYYDATNGHLKYAVKTGLVWTNETVDTGLNVGLYTSLALDGAGNPRISYRDGGNGDLKYAIGIPQLILNFTASSLYGTAPLNVQFSDTSTGGSPSCWNWSFGDGSWFNTSTTTQRNPVHVYETAGTYTVTMIVQNITVAGSLSKSGYITVITPSGTTIPTTSPTPTPTLSPTSLPTSPDNLTPTLTPTPVLIFSPSSSSLVSISDSSDDPPPGLYLTPIRLDAGPVMCQTVNVGGDSAVSRVIVTGRDISDIIITSHKITTLPPNTTHLDMPVYQFIDLIPIRYAFISAAIIEFDVPLTFIEDNHVTPDDVRLCMLRNQTWVCLPTLSLGHRNGRARYSADSPEFSIFAIALENKTFIAQRGNAFQTYPEKDTISKDTSGKFEFPVLSQTPVPPEPVEPDTGNSLVYIMISIASLCGFGIGAFIIYRQWIRR